MGNKLSCQNELVKKKETIFISRKVYRIPALFYNRDENILMALGLQHKGEEGWKSWSDNRGIYAKQLFYCYINWEDILSTLIHAMFIIFIFV